MPSQSETSGPETIGDGTQEIEDFLTTFKSLVAHPGPSHIGSVLTRTKSLQGDHDRLVEEQQRLENAHKDEIAILKMKDEESRRKSLKDYTDSVEALKKEKGQLSHENDDLKKQIEQQITAKQAAEEKYKIQLAKVDTLTKEMKQHEERANSANRQLQEVQKKLTDAQQYGKKFDATLKRRDLTEAKLKDETAAARSETQEAKRQMEKSSKQLEKLKGFVVQPNDVSLIDLTKGFDELWQDSLRMVKSAVAGDLPESTLKNQMMWQSMEKLAGMLPLPHSDSPGAKSMRAILILAVLAQAFVRHIFTTTYLLAEAGELDEILSLLAARASPHEFFVRSVLLRLFTDNEEEMIRCRVTSMTEDILSRIQDIIPPDRIESFKSDLKALVAKSAQTWSKFQRSRTHFEVTCEVESQPPWEWKILKLSIEGDEVLSDPTLLDPGNDALTVFPQLLSVDDDKDKLICHGIVITKSQLAEVEEEVRAEKAPLAAGVRRNSMRYRPRAREGSHGAMSEVTQNGFLGGH